MHNTSSYLTTDAAADPPRSNIPDEVTVNTEESKPRYSTKNGNFSKKKSPGKPKPKTGASKERCHATAKVINIVNSSNVHVGNNFNLFNNPNKNPTEKTTKKEDINMNEDISELLQNEDVISSRHVNFISRHLGEGWRNVGKLLGYSKGEMDHIYNDNFSSGHKEVVFQLLLDWQRLKTDDAKIGILAQALWDADEKEVVRRWAEDMKNV